jgi:hypothetical protein
MSDERARSSAPGRHSSDFQRLLARLGGNGYWIAAQAGFLCGWTLIWACRLGLLPPATMALGLCLVAMSLILIPFIPTLMARQRPGAAGN